jgi:hypothetical protein
MTDTENSQPRPTDAGYSNCGSEESLEITVIRKVAAEKDVDPTTLDPLYDVVNPDALEALFGPKLDGTPRAGGRVVFDYSGYHVTVASDGSVRAERLETR